MYIVYCILLYTTVLNYIPYFYGSINDDRRFELKPDAFEICDPSVSVDVADVAVRGACGLLGKFCTTLLQFSIAHKENLVPLLSPMYTTSISSSIGPQQLYMIIVIST